MIHWNKLLHGQCTYNFCTSSTNNRNVFDIKLLDLLEKQYEETEFTENKLPQEILDELTKDFVKPKMPRLSKKELYNLIQQNTTSLMPFANLLQHWTVDDDEKLQNELKEMSKDVNVVEIDKNKDDDNQSSDKEKIEKVNDADLMDIMDNKYLNEYKNNDDKIDKLYETALLFYDISGISSTSSISSAIDMNNRLASIFLILASHLGHTEAQC